MPKSCDICSSRQMQTHQHASLIYYALLWPKSVRSCVTEASHAHLFSVAHARTASDSECAAGWTVLLFLTGTTSFLIVLTSHSLPEVHEEAVVFPILLQGVSPNLAGCIIQAERFNRQALGDLAEGQGDTTQPAGPAPRALGVFMLLCMCNSLSSWREARPAGVPGSSYWLKWQGMQWMQALGLAAEQCAFRELTLQQWESDYKVLGLYCRLNMGCLNKEDTPSKEKTSSSALSTWKMNILTWIGCKGVLIYAPFSILFFFKFLQYHTITNSCFPMRFEEPEARDQCISVRHTSCARLLCLCV